MLREHVLKILQDRYRVMYNKSYLIKGAVSVGLIFLCTYNVFAEEVGKKSVLERIAGVGEAQAMPLPAPATPLHIPQLNTLFLSYINRPLLKKEPTEEELRKIPIYQPYYFIDDKKEQLEEKITEPINKSEWKDKINIDKISTKLDNDKVKFKVKFKEHNNKQKVFTLEAKPQDAYYEAKLSLKF